MERLVGDGGVALLVCRVGGLWCGLPLEDVVETMRPLSVELLKDMPSYVSGVALIRGRPTPVLAGERLLSGGNASTTATRFVLLRLGERRAAIAVDAVDTVRRVDPRTLGPVPPLLAVASSELVRAIGSLDRDLLLVLQRSLHLPASVWRALSVGAEGAGFP